MPDTDDFAQISPEELIQLAAVDSEFYCRTFFPRTVRQPFAPMHHDIWQKMESEARLVNNLMFRGSGKTSHCRLYTSKNLAYGLSRTILYTGKSEGHALRSTSWLKKAVENNTLWADTFKIRPGGKWQEAEFEVIVGAGTPNEMSTWIMAAGIQGSIRGLNRDDYRPDLIVLDDVLDDENAHTAEQRQKITTLVYGALMESLAPKSESPHAKMIGLNTPQNKEDFAVQALKDPGWVSSVHGCFTKETANFPTDYQESAWPQRFPTEELRAEKRSATARNMLSTFLREKECKLVSSETASFSIPWLQRYAYPPENMLTIYAIDPAPPPSDTAIAKGLIKTDFEAHVVWGISGDKRYLLDYALMRGHEPLWTIKTFFEFQQKYRPIKTLVESVAYQRTLLWILKQAMNQRRMWYPVTEFNDRRKKFNRIITAHNGPATAGKLFVRADQVDFLEQFGQFPDVTNDDLLDASSMALMELEGMFVGDNGELQVQGESSDSWKPINICVAP